MPLSLGKGPVPLRSSVPVLPDIAGIDRERVQAANKLYAFSARVFEILCRQAKVCVIENPTGSLMWLNTVDAENLEPGHFPSNPELHLRWGERQTHGLFSTDYQSREHAPWGKVCEQPVAFSTSSKAEYPVSFCAAVVTDVCAILSKVAGIWKASPCLIPQAGRGAFRHRVRHRHL